MISEICANWIFNNISYVNEISLDDIKMRLRDVEDKDVREIIVSNKNISFAELCIYLADKTSDLETKSHLLGYESHEVQMKTVNEVYDLMEKVTGSSFRKKKENENQYDNKRI